MPELLTVLGVAVAGVCAGLAAFVFAKDPSRPVNRRLALLLFVLGADLLTSGRVLGSLMEHGPSRLASARLHIMIDAALPPLYLLFVASALDTPVTRYLRRPWAKRGLVALALGAPLIVFMLPVAGGLVDGVRVIRSPIRLLGIFAWVGLGFVAAFLIALHAYLRTPRGPHRRSVGAYLAAFGVLDVSWGLFFLAQGFRFSQLPVVQDLAVTAWEPLYHAYGVAPLIFALLLTYGFLRTRLLGIDLRVKWTLEKSTILAVFGATFLAVSEVVEILLGLDGTLYGLLAAVSVGLIFRRVELGAERVADRIMPGVEDTPEYRARRKEEIYRAQLEELMADDQVTAKERRALLRLQEDLGLGGDDANRLEREVLEGPAG